HAPSVALVSFPTRRSSDLARIEAFSDGVFAIAITLLVLDMKVPRALDDGRTLASALGAMWPTYLAFVTSFSTILIMWINHHRMLDRKSTRLNSSHQIISYA